MTLVTERPQTPASPPPEPPPRQISLLNWLTSTDHKTIGISYMVTAFIFFLIGGLMAMLIRAELMFPEGEQIVTNDVYNELFTMHGTIMLLAFVGPFAFGLANYLVPIMIGARDMAFPRINLLSYWLYLAGGLVWLGGFATSDGAADFGWFAYTPLSDGVRSPGVGGDLWIAGVVLTGTASILSAVNITTTIYTMRTPGMTMFRMPIFCWNMVAVSILVLLVFPVVTAAGAMLYADRVFDAHIFDINNGGEPILWQHLFWFFGHPEVYILILPYFGVVTEIFPVFSRRPVFGYIGLVIATMTIAALSVGVWAHHMYVTGAVDLPFFGVMTMLIAVPTGVKFFNWIGTMMGGSISFETPMLFALGFLIVFVLGGVTGVMLAATPIDFHVSDSYFVVAHFHYVLFGGGIFALFAAIYYWFPKFTGRMLDERLGHIHFWLTFIGFNMTFFVQHILGLEGMPRRIPEYSDTFHALNLISSIGAFILGLATLPLIWNVIKSLRKEKDPRAADPWGGHTLEWWTSSPPPPENFDRPLPPILSERPVWDARHPDHRSGHHITTRDPEPSVS